MKTAVILSMLVLACTAYPLDYYLYRLPFSQHHFQGFAGEYNFGYQSPVSSRAELRDPFGDLVGSYSYVDDRGIVQTVNYKAGVNGFQVAGTTVPKVETSSELIPVPEPKELIEARNEFLTTYRKAEAGEIVAPSIYAVAESEDVVAARAEHLLVRERILEQLQQPIAPVELTPVPEPIEVIQARADHLAAYKLLEESS